MKRRPFATLPGAFLLVSGAGVPAAWATGGRAGAVQRIGWLSPAREGSDEALQGRRILHEWLRRSGYDEGRNLFVERRYAEGEPARLPVLAHELVQSGVDLIIALMNAAVAAARQATDRIPIVMLGATAPVELGFVQSLVQPGANVTGIALVGMDFPARTLQVLKEAAPATRRVVVLFNGQAPSARRFGPAADRMALSLGLQLEPVDVARARNIGLSLRQIAVRRTDGLFVLDDPVVDARLSDILGFARRHGLVSIGTTRQFVESGGMLCVEPDRAHLIERTVVFADRILRGARPRDLPVEQPGRYALIVNLATVAQQGRELPRTLLQRADEVIE